MKAGTRIILVLWLWSVITYLDRVAISFAGPAMMKSLSLTPASFGIILSSFGLGYMLAQVPGGVISDKWGARFVLAAGPLFWALFTGLTGLVSTLAGFVAVRICFGVSEGLAIPALHRVIGDEFEPQERARVFGFVFSGFAVGPLIAGPLVGLFVTAGGWRTMFFLMAVPALLVSLISFLMMPAPRTAPTLAGHCPHGNEESSLRAMLVRPSFWALAVFYFCYNMAFWGYIGWMPNYLALERHIALASLGLLAGIPYLFATFGLLFGGWLGTGPLHRHRPQLIGSFLLCGGLGLFAAYQAHGLTQSMAGLCGAALFLYGCQGAVGAVIQDLAPVRYRATYAGSVSTLGQLGSIVAPAVVGYLVTRTGSFLSGFTFMICALCLAAGSMLALITPLSAKRRGREQEIVSPRA